MESFIYPDWNNNIINISASFAKFLGKPNGKPTLPELDEALRKGYKNVLFVILDALGKYPLERNAEENGFFRSHLVRTLTTVFPSTTACASATLYSGLYPYEHGRFGWCMDIPEEGGRWDILTQEKSEDHSVKMDKKKMMEIFPLEPFFKDTPSDYHVTTLLSDILPGREEGKRCESFDELFDGLEEACSSEGKQFVYAHCPQPDGIFHHYGVTSAEGKAAVALLEKRMKALTEKYPDTLVVITADHGQVDITGYVPLYRDKRLAEMLARPLSIEVRAVSLTPKKGREEEFLRYMQETYGKDITVLKTSDLISRGVFGGDSEKTKRLGTYLGVGTFSHAIVLMHENTDCFLGQHTGLTEEMEVPLILIPT